MQTPTVPSPPVYYEVPSRTAAGVTYTVTRDAAGRFACDCPAKDFPKTRGRCWHVKACEAGIVAPAMQVVPTIATRFTNSTILAASLPAPAESIADRVNRLLYDA